MILDVMQNLTSVPPPVSFALAFVNPPSDAIPLVWSSSLSRVSPTRSLNRWTCTVSRSHHPIVTDSRRQGGRRDDIRTYIELLAVFSLSYGILLLDSPQPIQLNDFLAWVLIVEQCEDIWNIFGFIPQSYGVLCWCWRVQKTEAGLERKIRRWRINEKTVNELNMKALHIDSEKEKTRERDVYVVASEIPWGWGCRMAERLLQEVLGLAESSSLRNSKLGEDLKSIEFYFRVINKLADGPAYTWTTVMRNMDGRYSLQQGWENNSALEGYGAVHEPNYRVGGSYDDRRFIDERFPRDDVYPRSAFHRDIAERESYASPSVGLWSQTRRRSYEEEYSLGREPRRHEKPYLEPYHEMDTFREGNRYHVDAYQDVDNFRDGYHGSDSHREHGFDRVDRFGGRGRDGYAFDDYDYRHRRDDNRERDYDYGRRSYDSDYDRSRRDGSWRRRGSRDSERDRRGSSREREHSPHRSQERSRSRSRGRDDFPRSRSPRGRSHGRSHREDSYDNDRYDRGERRRDREEKRHDHLSVSPSATVVVKGLSQKTNEEDLKQILAEWGPLFHVRVIKERNSGISRGFAFIDFPSVDAAQAMMDIVGVDGLVVDGRKLFFEYSSKTTSGAAGPAYGQESARLTHGNNRSITVSSDWMCTICGCVNFARRVSCFQCNERRSDDAPAADIVSSSPAPSGRKGAEAGPTHVLVVRGLDENADEEMLRYEFSKHAPIKDLRLVRDKFTHVSKGFAFVHFYSVEDATKVLEATNGTTLEKNGQILRVAYAKSILGPGSGLSGHSQSSSLAAAAIEAATFAQQYDAIGWAPKEYNPEDKQSTGGPEHFGQVASQKEGSAPQSGFVWDEASGYYYDAVSGFYYDANTGLYYDGNNGIWYSYDQQTLQYIPCSDQNANNGPEKRSEAAKEENNNTRKVVISAPAAVLTSNEKPASLPDAVHAAASAALAAEKKEKEKSKEIKLALKSSILANKKKMNNVLSMWKQRSHEGQAPRVALDDGQPPAAADERLNAVGPSSKSKSKYEAVATMENAAASSGFTLAVSGTQATSSESEIKPRPVSNSSGGTIMGVIRGSGRGVIKSDTIYSGSSGRAATPTSLSVSPVRSSVTSDVSGAVTPFRTDASALGSYTTPAVAGSGKRRFSEAPLQSAPAHKEQQQVTYRDRAAERRSLYGSSSSHGNDLSDLEVGDPNQDLGFRKGASDVGSMPFPPGVGGRGISDSNVQSYDVITAEKAIDESNVGNRMLRNMGWHEGSGLGKDRSGMVEPVQAQAIESRSGLGSQRKKRDPNLEVQPGDSYKTLIQKKALARFREMS
ncbi:hypothetical protein Nepgr_011095 [Nepenthes gracilis]|uniref:Uncharacterized protein n=1 Tax=Nepenthes gracilis TaxID=150966 RepID=A0AAD3XLY7_NEPGR|nr:hypothetical protein Nepgr_011095 [Nepenthes gracilis]